ncbi:hydantoinase/oxoprolinase family protein [[Eubacterium] cellulosolvens]
MIVATDVGGTFTDYTIFDQGKVRAFKALTTPNPSHGILERLQGKEIKEFSHGTTSAVNAVLERAGAPVVFLTTKGFKDLVQIGRQARNNVYSFICEKPVPPVETMVEVNERTGSDGTVLKPVAVDHIENIAKKYSKSYTSAVVGFINSYTNPKNEVVAEKVLTKYFPMVVASHNVRREIREYERFCTTIIEGYCAPVVNNYLKELGAVSENFYVMQSNGGRAEIEHLHAVNMIMSGPAGGVAATQALCKRLGIDNAIAYDMGGTSADVSAVVGGAPVFTDTVHITGLPIKTLAIDIESIGAGGGSIAWVDDGGALKVGPESAGAQPGPACYNQGGNKFTVSDANLIIGVLGDYISEIRLHKGKALEAAKPLCQDFDMDALSLSAGVRQIVNNNMVSALKRISIGKGYDPRIFTLVAFGGAGPMHACAIAEIMGIKRIIIPPMAGAFSALGIMSAPIRFDYVRTILLPLDKAIEKITSVLEEFQDDLMIKTASKYKEIFTQISLDLRYYGQGHELNIPMSADLAHAFHEKHEALFGFCMPGNTVEVVNVKLVAEIPAQVLPVNKFPKNSPNIKKTRDVHPDKDVPVYLRDFHGAGVEGPCIIEDDTTTIFVAPGWNAKLDLHDVLILERD